MKQTFKIFLAGFIILVCCSFKGLDPKTPKGKHEKSVEDITPPDPCDGVEPGTKLTEAEVKAGSKNYVIGVSKSKHRVFELDADELQYMIKQSQTTGKKLYFIMHGKAGKGSMAVTVTDPRTSPIHVAKFYKIGTALCPPPSTCGFPFVDGPIKKKKN